MSDSAESLAKRPCPEDSTASAVEPPAKRQRRPPRPPEVIAAEKAAKEQRRVLREAEAQRRADLHRALFQREKNHALLEYIERMATFDESVVLPRVRHMVADGASVMFNEPPGRRSTLSAALGYVTPGLVRYFAELGVSWKDCLWRGINTPIGRLTGTTGHVTVCSRLGFISVLVSEMGCTQHTPYAAGFALTVAPLFCGSVQGFYPGYYQRPSYTLAERFASVITGLVVNNLCTHVRTPASPPEMGLVVISDATPLHPGAPGCPCTFPLKVDYSHEPAAYAACGAFSVLPDEMLVAVFARATPHAVCMLGATCRRLLRVSKDRDVSAAIVAHTFPTTADAALARLRTYTPKQQHTAVRRIAFCFARPEVAYAWHAHGLARHWEREEPRCTETSAMATITTTTTTQQAPPAPQTLY
jgi:hypothetical protein